MATLHLKIPGIDGDSEADGYEGQIDLTSWSWGASQSGNMHLATGGAKGGSSVMDVNVTKAMDKASPNLMSACCTGRHFTEDVVLTCTKSGDGQVRWLELTLKDTIISSISPSSSEGEQGYESMSLNFREYMMKFFPQEGEGAEGSSIDAGYDIRKQVKV